MYTNNNTRIELKLNGQEVDLDADGERTLLDVLRSECGLTSPRYGCGLAQCGACTVLVDGEAARSCVMRISSVAGRSVTTLEGLADAETGALHPVQQGFLECEGAQCGYCLNGMVMMAAALLATDPKPDEEAVRQALRHNLCRCGTHSEIIASVLRAAELMDQSS